MARREEPRRCLDAASLEALSLTLASPLSLPGKGDTEMTLHTAVERRDAQPLARRGEKSLAKARAALPRACDARFGEKVKKRVFLLKTNLPSPQRARLTIADGRQVCHAVGPQVRMLLIHQLRGRPRGPLCAGLRLLGSLHSLFGAYAVGSLAQAFAAMASLRPPRPWRRWRPCHPPQKISLSPGACSRPKPQP